MPEKTETFSHQLQTRISSIEKRDWELWILALGMVGILSVGYFIVVFPAVFLNQRTFFIQAKISPPLLIGQLTLVLLFLAYLVHKQIQVRRLRSESVVEAVNYQLSHAQFLLDPLTQAFNRSALENVIQKEVLRAQRKQTTLVFLYVDLNDLKKVNTRFGHLSGDLVLSETGGLLKQSVRGSDYVIRIGGDEFLVVLVDTSVEGATVVKERIKARAVTWNETTPLAGFRLELSIGLELFDGSRSFDDVLADADAKMFAEKKATAAGRNAVAASS